MRHEDSFGDVAPGSHTGSNLGRHVFGAAALAFGLIVLAWHDYNGWHLPPTIVYAASAAALFGGAAMQFRRTSKAGSAVLSAIFLVCVLRCVPQIRVQPRIYNSWGNFFEQFCLMTGAAIVYARLSFPWSREALGRVGRISLGICTASFTLEQAVYLSATATLVPKWLPPSPIFWAVVTTVLFALAALALLANRMALLAARLLIMMLATFGLVVWMPLLISDSHNPANWSETAETFAIAGAVWILADLLSEARVNGNRPR